jgi:hypothetical protein
MKKLLILFLFPLIGFSQAGFYKLEKDPQGKYVKKANDCSTQDTAYSIMYAPNEVSALGWSLKIALKDTYTYPNRGWYYADNLNDALTQMGIAVDTWQTGKAYQVDEIVTYLNKRYKCLQGHTSQSDWIPTVTPALWTLLATNNNWTVGVAYKVNDYVLYIPNGFRYKCIQAHTAQAGWNPPAVPALWTKQN